MYTYRQVADHELALLRQLIEVFGEAFDDRDTYSGAPPSDAYLEALLARPEFIVVVAMHAGQVVGGLAAYELTKFERERREIYIYDLAVDHQHRRRGIATAVIKELRRVAAIRRAYVIFVQADPGDMPAIRLYESLGIREDVHHFDIAVPGAPS
jgi:aminoglycoside 3-N-acetyltransferase I